MPINENISLLFLRFFFLPSFPIRFSWKPSSKQVVFKAVAYQWPSKKNEIWHDFSSFLCHLVVIEYFINRKKSFNNQFDLKKSTHTLQTSEWCSSTKLSKHLDKFSHKIWWYACHLWLNIYHNYHQYRSIYTYNSTSDAYDFLFTLIIISFSLSLVFFFYPMSFVIVRCEIISALVPLSTSFLSIGFMYESMMKKRLPLLPALKKSYLWEKCLSVFFFLLSPNINVLL